MFRRRLEPEDKRFIELAFCIFTHTSENHVEFGVVEKQQNTYSLPRIELKIDESIEEARNFGMKNYVCENSEIQMVPIVNRVFDCFASQESSVFTIAYRIDIPKSHVDNKGLKWLTFDGLFDALDKEKFYSEKDTNIVLKAIHTS